MRRFAASLAVVATIASTVLAGSSAAATTPPGALLIGQQLVSGQALYSPDHRFVLTMQTDGNLVLRSPTSVALWSSGTPGHPGAVLTLQGDGNLVLRSAAGPALWNTATMGKGSAVLAVQVDGDLVLRPNAGAAVWATRTVPAAGTATNPRVAPQASGSVLLMGAALVAGHQLTSPNGQYRSVMQSDGNVVTYGPMGVVWSSNSAGWAGAALSLQTDGNLVLRAATGAALWNTGTSRRGPDWLSLQNDGSLVLMPAIGAALWNSATAADPVVAAAPGSAIASGAWAITGHGNGHGHGLSQYGAFGRAQAGQSMAQIIAFYYANTTLAAKSAAMAATSVRVLLSNTGSYPTVFATAGLTATGIGALTTAGATQYRLIPAAAGLALQALVGPTWATTRTGLPSTVTFAPGSAALRLVRATGAMVTYRGTIAGVRSGAGVIAVNTLGLDDYVRGVAPNESPASWPGAAVQAQVVAARTYARFEVHSVAGAGAYDICDTSSCQVYGGQSSEAAASNAAVDVTQGQIVTYAGQAVFAQFGSSNGGWTFDGGQPYLIAQADPYDNAATDPWYNWTRTVQVSSVARYYGLTSISALRITGRNGHGDWGGAVTAAQIDGVRNGVTTTISVTGSSLRSAMGLPLEWFTVTN